MISSLGYKKARMPSTSWGQVDEELWLIYMNVFLMYVKGHNPSYFHHNEV
jgi:hypothetical protein